MARLIFSYTNGKDIDRAKKYADKYHKQKNDGKTGSKKGNKKEVS